MGVDMAGVVLVVCHTYHEAAAGAMIRLISARKATKHEARQYRRA